MATQTLRNIATRCRPAGSQVTASTLCFGRTLHINRGGTQTALQLVYSNWWASFNGEVANAQPLTVSASIEYPEGVYTQALFGGAATVAIAGGANAVSDVTNVGIPNGATFWVRTYQSCSAGTLTSITACLDRMAATVGSVGGRTTIETAAYGTSATTDPDATMVVYGSGVRVNGYGPAGTSSNGYFPTAILGMSSVPAVLVLGDSRNAGLQDSAQSNVGLSGVGEFCRSLDSAIPYCNAGYPTDQGATFVANHTYRSSLAPYYTHIHSQYGINDLIFAQTLAQLQATQAAIFGIFPGKTYSLSTLPPVTTSTDAWATNANQTISASGTVAASRSAYNTWVLTKPLSVQNAFDVAGVCEEPTTPGKWKSPDISTWTNKAGTTAAITAAVTGDGTHETPYMYGLIQKTNAINTALIL